MAKNVEFDENAFYKFLKEDKSLNNFMAEQANKVLNEAKRTASDAENGAGGTIDGYASAGFRLEVESGKKYNEYKIISNAKPKIALAALFHSQRKNGIAHLRAALYKFTRSDNYKRYPVGKKYTWRGPGKGKYKLGR
jgi:hypothetical protein